MMMTSSMAMGSVLWMEGVGLILARSIAERFALETSSAHGRGHDPDGGGHPHPAIGARLAPKVVGDDAQNMGAQVRVLAQHGGERAHPLGDDHAVFEAPAPDSRVEKAHSARSRFCRHAVPIRRWDARHRLSATCKS